MKKYFVTILSYTLSYLALATAINDQYSVSIFLFTVSLAVMVLLAVYGRHQENYFVILVSFLVQVVSLLSIVKSFAYPMVTALCGIILYHLSFNYVVSSFSNVLQGKVIKTTSLMTLALTGLLLVIHMFLKLITGGMGIIPAYWIIVVLLMENNAVLLINRQLSLHNTAVNKVLQ